MTRVRLPSTRTLLLIILGLGLALRLIHFAAVARSAYPELPTLFEQSDMHGFATWAESIRAGDLWGEDTFHPYTSWMHAIAPLSTWERWWGGKAVFQQAPGYAYLLALLLVLTGGSMTGVLLLQTILGTAVVAVAFALARRMFDARVGLVAAGLCALYGPFLFFQGVILRDWLVPILDLLLLWLTLRALDRRSWPGWLAAGAVLGVSLLFKPAVLLFVPVLLGWLVFSLRKEPRRLGVAAGCVLLGFALLLSPLLIRNAKVGAPWLAVSNRGTDAFIVGNTADARPIGLHLPESMGPIYEKTDGRLGAVIVETLSTHEGLGSFLGLQLHKLRGMIDPFEVPNNVSYAHGREVSPLLGWLLQYWMIFPLGLAGLVWACMRRPRNGLVLCFAGVQVVVVVSTSILARYRLSLAALLMVYAAAGLVWAVDGLRARRWRPPAAYLGGVAAAALMQLVVLPIGATRQNAFCALHPPSYLISAQAYQQAGRFDAAVAELERLATRARQNPAFHAVLEQALGHQAFVRLAWSDRLIERGRLDEARAQVSVAEALPAGQAENPLLMLALGRSHLRLGQFEQGRAWLERVIAARPGSDLATKAQRWLSRLSQAP
ncbi:MAG: glycosyltransferase family 39 protein [Deltaproteobacteria bacterium]|nr:glycosyltransferase family 39 protein [Deltaproteobacteria bacterium]